MSRAPKRIGIVTLVAILSCVWVGEMTWARLKLSGVETMQIQKKSAFYQPVRKTPKASILMVLDSHLHGNNPKLIKPLRRAFAQYQWVSMSIQVTQSKNSESLIKEALKKLQVKAKAQSSYILVYGDNALSVLKIVSDNKDTLDGVILLSATKFDKGESIIKKLKSEKMPIIDIIAERDYEKVLDAQQQRLELWQPSSDYRQVIIAGTDSYYSGQINYLSKVIRGYLTFKSGRRS